MYNQIKSDIYKLIHSKASVVSIIMVMIIGVIAINAGEIAFMYSGDTLNPSQSVGFSSRFYMDILEPTITEIIRTALSYTVFFWVVALAFTGQFFSKEYTDGTLKVMVAHGTKRTQIYMSKLLVSLVYILMGYLLFTATIFFIETFRLGFAVSMEDIGVFSVMVGLSSLVFCTFITFVLLLFALIKNIMVTTTLMCIFVFSGPMVYMMIWDKMEQQPLLMQWFVKINPMYYWMNICNYHLQGHIIPEIICYGVMGSIICIILTLLVVKKQEIK